MPVRCELCGREMGTISPTHLKHKHNGMTVPDYREMFPDAPIRSLEAAKGTSVGLKDKPKSPEHKAKLAAFNKSRSGPKNPSWRGGVWRDRPKDQNWYPDGFNAELTAYIREIDNHRCRLCGIRAKLYVHHIDLDREHNTDDNLISLCAKCHFGKVHHNRYKDDKEAQQWVVILKKLVLEREKGEPFSPSLYLF